MHRGLTSAVAASVALALAGAGCGDSDEDEPATDVTTTSTEAQVEEAAEEVEVLGATMVSATAGTPGAVVVSVEASLTKLKAGDVITEVNGKRVESVDDLLDEAGSPALGEQVQLNVRRGSETFPLVIVPTAPVYLGVEVRDAKGGGAEVIAVTPDSPAADAGLKKGDVITEAGGEKIDEREELPQVVASHDPGEEIKITADRDGEEITVTATLAENPATSGG